MMKISMAFLGGTVFATLAMVTAGGRPAGWLALGFFLAVSISAGVLWLTGLRRLARFLNAFMDGLEGSQRPASRIQAVEVSGYVKPSKRQQLAVMNDTIEEYRSRSARPERTSAPNPETADFLNDEALFGAGKVA